MTEYQRSRILSESPQHGPVILAELDVMASDLAAFRSHDRCNAGLRSLLKTAEEEIAGLREALGAMWEHFGTLEDNHMMNRDCVNACKLARKALANKTGGKL